MERYGSVLRDITAEPAGSSIGRLQLRTFAAGPGSVYHYSGRQDISEHDSVRARTEDRINIPSPLTLVQHSLECSMF